jgi:hypothetical protein
VVGRGDGAAGALITADRPVLVVAVAAVDQADVVGAAVAGQGSLGGTTAARVVAPEVLEDLTGCCYYLGACIEGSLSCIGGELLRSSRHAATRCTRQGKSCPSTGHYRRS